MKDYKAIFFDAGGTLIHPDRTFILDTLAENGIARDEAAFMIADQSARETRSAAIRSGEVLDDATSWRIYAARLLDVLGCTPDIATEVTRAIGRRHRAGTLWIQVEEGTAETLAELKGLGYTLCVVSNADGRVEQFLEKAGLRQHLDHVIDSGRVGVEKPDPRIFEIACTTAGVSADEVVHVGDVYEVDVLGARAAGLDAVLLVANGGPAPEGVPVIRSLPELTRVIDQLKHNHA